jgi:hypothetical protein
LPEDYEGNTYGHIDFINQFYFMDVVRLVGQSGQLTPNEQEEIVAWFTQLLHYLTQSAPGAAGYLRPNNIGTYQDLLVMSVASFVGDLDYLVTTTPWAIGRLWEQVNATNGALPTELARPACMHYQMYCLQAWINVARVAQGIGYNLWQADRNGTEPLCQAVEYVLSRRAACDDIGEDVPDLRNLWPIWMEASPHCPGITNPTAMTTHDDTTTNSNSVVLTSPYDMPGVFWLSDEIADFWNLGMEDYDGGA